MSVPNTFSTSFVGRNNLHMVIRLPNCGTMHVGEFKGELMTPPFIYEFFHKDLLNVHERYAAPIDLLQMKCDLPLP